MPKTIAEAFTRAAQRFPTRPALISTCYSSVGHGIITYSKLLSVARQSAKKAFRDGQVIVVGIEEGCDLVAVELAAWLAGAAVCPFDVRKDPRSKDVISMLNPDLVVIANNDDTVYSFPNVNCQKANEIIDWDQAEAEVDNDHIQLPSEDALSHLVFTSGTTGLPKCVGVTNKSLLMFAKAKTSCSKIDENSRIFLASSFTFDPQLGDIACALSTGACLILPQRNALLSGMLGSLLSSFQATHVCTTPAALSMISSPLDFQYLKEILVGGEKMPPALVERLLEECKRTGTRLVNTYGVTECCVYQAIKPVNKRGDESYLGSAYPGVEILLVQFNNSEVDLTSWRVCGPGEEGEIVIGGPLLGMGYLSTQPQSADETNKKRPRGMTAVFEKRDGFVKDFYRTGDIGVLDKITNEILLLGRRDSQFKVNGIRIEAGEVEHALETKAGSIYSNAIALNLGGKLVACGVVSPQDAKVLDLSQGCCRLPNCMSVCLGRYMSKALPDAYVPSVYFAVESIPVAATGKVDRKRLEALVAIAQESSKHSSAALKMDGSNDGSNRNDTGASDEIELALQSQESSTSTNQTVSVLEKFLSNVWCEILGLSSVEPTDNFRELGGDSLVALKGINMLLTTFREHTTTVGRDQVHPSLMEAMDEAQKYGEIAGPFSAVALLTSANLRSYAASLLPYLKGLEAFELEGAKSSSGKEDDDLMDIQPEEDPALLKALMDASTLGLPQTIRAILQLGTVSSDGRFVPRKRMCRAPLHNASQTGSVEAIRVLAGEFSARVMCVTTSRVSPLHLAPTVPALLELAKFARQQRSDVRPMAVEDKNQQTPIHFAARLGRSDCIRAFVEEQLSQATPPNRNLSNEELVRKTINGLDKWRRTPLHWAVVNGHTETVKVLLELGAVAKHLGLKLGQPGPTSHLPQETALELALRRGASTELIEILREAEKREEAARKA